MGGGIADSAHGSRRTRKVECAGNEPGHGGGAPQCVAGGPRATDVGAKAPVVAGRAAHSSAESRRTKRRARSWQCGQDVRPTG